MKKILLIILSILLFTGCSKETCTKKSTDEIMYLSSGVLIKFEFKEEFDSCTKGDESYIKNENTLVTNFELINEDAKLNFNNIDFKNKTIEEVLNLFEETANKNKLEIKELNIYTTSKKDYSSYVSYKVNDTVYDKNTIDTVINKKMPLNKTFEIKAEAGMEYYFMYYEFISDTEVKYYTKGLCYGECEENETYKYTSNYDIKTDKILIVIDNGYNTTYTYSFSDDTLTFGNHIEG